MDHQHAGTPGLNGVVIDEIAGERRGALLVIDPLGFRRSLRRAGLQDHGSSGKDERHETCDFYAGNIHGLLRNAFVQLLHCAHFGSARQDLLVANCPDEVRVSARTELC